MVIVLSDTGRTDIENVKCEEVDSESTEAAGLNKQTTYGKGPFFLLVTADEWNHDDDQWLGIYVSKKEAKEAQAIIDMRLRMFCDKERKKISEEIDSLQV